MPDKKDPKWKESKKFDDMFEGWEEKESESPEETKEKPKPEDPNDKLFKTYRMNRTYRKIFEKKYKDKPLFIDEQPSKEFLEIYLTNANQDEINEFEYQRLNEVNRELFNALTKPPKTEEVKAEIVEKKESKPEITIKDGVVYTTEIVDGETYNTVYDSWDTCRICNKERWISGQTAGCLICDKVMTVEQYNKYIQANMKKEEVIEKKDSNLSPKQEKAIKKITDATGLTAKEITERVEAKKKELKGLISIEGAIFLIGKEFGVDIPDFAGKSVPPETKKAPTKKKTETPPKKEEKGEDKKPPIIKKEEKTIPKQIIQEGKYEIIPQPYIPPIAEIQHLTLEQKQQNITEAIQLYEFTVNKVIKDSDYQEIGNRKFIKKSGCLKLATAFNLSIQILSVDITKDYDKNGKEIDIIATAKARVIRANGSSVEATADKSRSEYKGSNYNLHNLKATAATRATNRAILNAVGFGEVSAEEIPNEAKEKGKEDWNDY